MRFWHGFVTAVVMVEALALLAIGWVIAPPMVGMVRDIGGPDAMPASFELVTSSAWAPAWGLGLPLLAFAVLRGGGSSKRGLAALVGVAVVGLAVAAFTLVSIYGPLYETTSHIH